MVSLVKQKELCNYIGRKNDESEKDITKNIGQFILDGADINARSPFPKHEQEIPLNIAINNGNISMFNSILSFNPRLEHQYLYSLYLCSLQDNPDFFDILFNKILQKFSLSDIKEEVLSTRIPDKEHKNIFLYTAFVLNNKENELNVLCNTLGIDKKDFHKDDIASIIKQSVATYNNINLEKYLSLYPDDAYVMRNPLKYFSVDLRQKKYIEELSNIIAKDLTNRNNDRIILNLGEHYLKVIGETFFNSMDKFYQQKNNESIKEKLPTISFLTSLIKSGKTEKAVKLVKKGFPVTVNTGSNYKPVIKDTHLISAWYTTKLNTSKDLISDFEVIYNNFDIKHQRFAMQKPSDSIQSNDAEPLTIVDMALNLLDKQEPKLLQLLMNKNEIDLSIYEQLLFRICCSEEMLYNSENCYDIVNNYLKKQPNLSKKDIYYLYMNEPNLFNLIRDNYEIDKFDISERYALSVFGTSFKGDYAKMRIQDLNEKISEKNSYLLPDVILNYIEKNKDETSSEHYQDIKQYIYPVLEKHCFSKILSQTLPKQKNRL